MKIIRKLLASAAVLGMALSGAAIGEGTADASTVPVVYAAHNDGWHVYVKPGSFYFGNGGAPYFTGLHWTSWNSASAWATGRLWTQKPGCSPSYKCLYYSRWAGVYLNTIRWHNGVRYYARMAVKLWYAGKWRWEVGWFRNGFWTFPLVPPYLQPGYPRAELRVDPPRPETVRRYAADHGITFTAALSLLAARGLREGITIKGDGTDENDT